MINLQKIQESIKGLEIQREQLKTQLNMVEGAIQYCLQLVETDGGEKSPPDEKEVVNVPKETQEQVSEPVS